MSTTPRSLINTIPAPLIRSATRRFGVRATSGTVDVHHKGSRVASHPRSSIQYPCSTIPRTPPGLAPRDARMDAVAVDGVGPIDRARDGRPYRPRHHANHSAAHKGPFKPLLSLCWALHLSQDQGVEVLTPSIDALPWLRPVQAGRDTAKD